MGLTTFNFSIFLFVELLIQACNGQYLCGSPNKTPYNPLVHRCVDNVLQRRNLLTTENKPEKGFKVCFSIETGVFKKYDKDKYFCNGGELVEKKQPTSTTSASTRHVVMTTTSRELLTAMSKASHACRSGQPWLLPTGFDCCYDKPYRPEDETCCEQSGIREIFNGSERTHICCLEKHGFSINVRGSPDIPCQHASTNDKFFHKVKRLKIPEDELYRTCEKIKYAFRIDVEKQTTSNDNFRLFARLTAWKFSLNARRKKIRKLKSPYGDDLIGISKDKFSPSKSKMRPKSFLILTDFNYFSQAVFFLKPNDFLFKFPRNDDRLKKVLKRLSRKCRKSKRKV